MNSEMLASQEGMSPRTRSGLSHPVYSHVEVAPQRCPSNRQWQCLYTKHKTQKRRIWHDGRLVLKGGQAQLHKAIPVPGSDDPVLDNADISTGVLVANTQLETEKFLIQLEGPWQGKPPVLNNTINTLNTNSRPGTSAAMQKLLNRKFQKPKAYVPPPLQTRLDRLQKVLGKRRRPLQPGELERLHQSNSGRGDRDLCAVGNYRGHGVGLGGQASHGNHDGNGGQRHDQGVSIHWTIRRAQQQLELPKKQQLPSYHQSPTPQQPSVRMLVNGTDPINNSNLAVMTTPASSTSKKSERAGLGAPNSFVLGQLGLADALPPPEVSALLQTKQSSQSTAFLSNEFNAARFYGLDEDEDDDAIGNPNTSQNSGLWTIPSSTNITTTLALSTDIDAASSLIDMSPLAAQSGPEEALPFGKPSPPNPIAFARRSDATKLTTNHMNHNGKGRSNKDLLALFGAIHVPAPGGGSNSDSSTRHSSTAIVPSSQPPVANMNNKNVLSSLRFVLPPASQSSSESGDDLREE